MSSLEVPDARLYYEIHGIGPLMVLITGAPGVADIYRAVIPYEPPALRLLPDGDTWADFFSEVYDLYLREGIEREERMTVVGQERADAGHQGDRCRSAQQQSHAEHPGQAFYPLERRCGMEHTTYANQRGLPTGAEREGGRPAGGQADQCGGDLLGREAPQRTGSDHGLGVPARQAVGQPLVMVEHYRIQVAVAPAEQSEQLRVLASFHAGPGQDDGAAREHTDDCGARDQERTGRRQALAVGEHGGTRFEQPGQATRMSLGNQIAAATI
ncbi:hypothetical protein [Nonomuraea sp. B19D2]|uniref:hypothetical protein n=1 Tax=Nonomuraea sp. B19D2 TaxID=3159561 RepID=UPI0032DB19AB